MSADGADASRTARREPRILVGTLFAAAIVAIAFAAAWPVYRTPWLVVTAGGAVAAASLIAAVAWRRSWRVGTTAWVTAAAFLVLGVPLAVPARVAGPGEFAQGLGDVAAGVLVGFKDLVTVDLPIGTYRNLLVPAFAVFLAGTCALLLLAWRRDRIAYAAVPVAAGMTAFGLLFGAPAVSDPLVLGPVVLPAPVETALGALTFLACLLWLVWRGDHERMLALSLAAENSGVRLARERSPAHRRRGVLAAVMVATALLVSVAVVPFAAQATTRDVLRAAAGPDVELSASASPLSEYRTMFADDRAEDVLFTVVSDDGLPERVRIATLDAYDGEVFRSGDDGAVDDARFVRVPAELDAGEGDRTSVEITVGTLEGIWMPTVGRVRSVDFGGPRAAELDASFYYNRTAWAGVQTAAGGLAAGDVIRLEVVVPDEPSLASIAAPGGAASSVAAPEALTAWVDRHSAGSGGEALSGLVALLRERGYLSHGLEAEADAVWVRSLPGYSFQPSASGHSLARIQTMFTRLLEREADPRAAATGVYVAAIGDDEQFAVAVALVARELGFPSRVVVGTRLTSVDPGVPVCDEGVCRAQDLAVWAEVQSADGSWVAIDATPQHTQSPSLVVTEARDPENVTDVLPDAVEDVVPPDPLQEDTGVRDGGGVDDGWDLAWLWRAARIVGVGLLLLLIAAAPLLVVVGAKAVRRRARRRALTPGARIVGGWDEYVDTAADAGLAGGGRLTRSELAARIATAGGPALAARADRAVFSGQDPDDDQAEEFWRLVDAERAGIRHAQTFWGRVAMTVSLKSFVRPLAPARAARIRPERGKRATASLARIAP